MNQNRLAVTWVKSRTDKKFGQVLDIALNGYHLVYTIAEDEKNQRLVGSWRGWHVEITEEEGPLLHGEYLRLFKGPLAELWSMHKVLVVEKCWAGAPNHGSGAGETTERIRREKNVHEVLSGEEREIHRRYIQEMLELRRKQVKNLEILLENT